jgi:hypothetical protein
MGKHMIIGHAPAGYITTDLLHRKFVGRHVPRTAFFIASILGALMPDIDMLYFHLVDHRQHHHHSYFTHFPIF